MWLSEQRVQSYFGDNRLVGNFVDGGMGVKGTMHSPQEARLTLVRDAEGQDLLQGNTSLLGNPGWVRGRGRGGVNPRARQTGASDLDLPYSRLNILRGQESGKFTQDRLMGEHLQPSAPAQLL